MVSAFLKESSEGCLDLFDVSGNFFWVNMRIIKLVIDIDNVVDNEFGEVVACTIKIVEFVGNNSGKVCWHAVRGNLLSLSNQSDSIKGQLIVILINHILKRAEMEPSQVNAYTSRIPNISCKKS